MSELVRIVTATTDADFTLIASLSRTVFFEHYTAFISQRQATYMLERAYQASTLADQSREGYVFHLAFHDQESQGYISFHQDHDTLWLDKINVLGKARGHGVGYALFRSALSIHTNTTPQFIRLAVNRKNDVAIAAYQRWGFRVERSE